MNNRNCESEPTMSGSVDKLRVEFDRWMNLARMNGERALETMGIRAFTGSPWVPEVDVDELKGEILVFVDLPGVTADRVQLSLTGNMLTLKGSKPPAAVSSQVEHRFRERRQGEFERAIPLPAPVDPDGVTAEVRDGVLFVRLKKSVEEIERHIKVVSAENPVDPPEAVPTCVPIQTGEPAAPATESPAPDPSM